MSTSPAPRRLTHDDRHEYPGVLRASGICRVRVYAPESLDDPPVIIVTELRDNTGSSVTDVAEQLAAELIAKHCPHRFDYDEPVIFLEHYEDPPDHRRAGVADVYRVLFNSWRPFVTRFGACRRTSLGEPSWEPVTREQLIAWIGTDEL